MKKILLALLFVSHISYAELNLLPVSLENQHGKIQTVNKQTKLVIFTHDMSGKDIVNNALNELPKDFLSQHSALCIADVEAMPAIIARLFAYPAMRDYSYNIMLDKTGETSKKWPRKEDAVTLLYLQGGNVEKHQFFTDAKALLAAIKGN